MGNVYLEPASTTTARRPGNRTLVWAGTVLLVAALVMASSWAGREAIPTDPPSGAMELSRAQQAEADRLNARAEAFALEQAARRREAEAARWTALAEHHRRERAAQAERDRLTGLAERESVFPSP